LRGFHLGSRQVGQASIFQRPKRAQASRGTPVQKLKTFLDRDFFESDDTNKIALGMGFAAGVAMLLAVVGLGLVF
jgi:hypothetical protein